MLTYNSQQVNLTNEEYLRGLAEVLDELAVRPQLQEVVLSEPLQSAQQVLLLGLQMALVLLQPRALPAVRDGRPQGCPRA